MEEQFNYFKPHTLPEALELLDTHGCKVLAGGTDLLVQIKRGTEKPTSVVDIKGIAELQRFNYTPGLGLFIGSAVTVNTIGAAPTVAEKYPALRDAANSLASYQLRNRATLAGNICHASPAADLAPPLLVYDAVVHTTGNSGSRTISINQFFAGPKQTVLCPQEIVTGVFIPDVAAGDAGIYLKQTRIKGHDLGIVGAAVRRTSQGKLCLALSAVAPTPVRLFPLEEVFAGEKWHLAAKVAQAAGNYISPITDVRSSAEYRSHMVKVLLTRAVTSLFYEGGRGDV